MTCRGEAPEVEQFARQNAGTVRVIGMGAQDDLSYAQEFVATTGTESFPMVWDQTFETWRHYGVTGQPTAILLDADGNEIQTWRGRLPFDELLAAAENA